MKIAIIGAGNLGGAMAVGLAKGTTFAAEDIICTFRRQEKLDAFHAAHPELSVTLDNHAAVRAAEVVVFAVKPWYIEPIIEELKPSFDYSRQIIISVAAGITTEQLYSLLLKNGKYIAPTIFRVIPNTAIDVLSSMTFVCSRNATEEQAQFVMNFFKELGNAMVVEERLMNAGTALASCGIAYAMRYIRAAIEGGVEMGFYPREAQEIVLHTVKGAVDLLLEHNSNPEQEIDKVTTPGGITIKGLNEMELAGFTSAVIRGLKAGI